MKGRATPGATQRSRDPPGVAGECVRGWGALLPLLSREPRPLVHGDMGVTSALDDISRA